MEKKVKNNIPQILEKDVIVKTPFGKMSWNGFVKFYQKYMCIREVIENEEQLDL